MSDIDRMSDERLQQIQQRADAATKGPWTNISDWPEVWSESEEYFGRFVALVGVAKMVNKTKCAMQPPDSRFIAHSRADVPDLLAEVKRQREELKKANALAVDRLELLKILADENKWVTYERGIDASLYTTEDVMKRIFMLVDAAEAPHE